MLFNSYGFVFVFLPIVVAGFLLLGAAGRSRLAAGWLLLSSLFFYAWWHPPYLALLLLSIAVNRALGRLVAPTPGRSEARRRAALTFGLAANLGALGYYKYAGFLTDNLDTLLGTGLGPVAVALPLAISFFTFQQIAYLVDGYRGAVAPHGFLDYALFVSCFPQLIAGPIVRQDEMLPQLRTRHFGRMRGSELSIGLTLFGIGLFKKVMIADELAPYASSVFAAASDGTGLGTLQAWSGTLAYSFQIYFDFSGYSDMAIGLGRMFGLRLPINFASPYKASSLADFWRRWHISLSTFLRDYLYIPLGGNRRGSARRYANLVVTMLLGGLWHGAGWTFVAWGAVHGLGLVVDHALRRLPAVAAGGRWVRVLGAPLTFLWVTLAWVFFRADGLASANAVLASLFGFGGVESALAVDEPAFLAVLIPAAAIAWLAPNAQQILALPGVNPPPRLRWSPSFGWAAATALLFAVAVAHLERPTEFLYFQF